MIINFHQFHQFVTCKPLTDDLQNLIFLLIWLKPVWLSYSSTFLMTKYRFCVLFISLHTYTQTDSCHILHCPLSWLRGDSLLIWWQTLLTEGPLGPQALSLSFSLLLTYSSSHGKWYVLWVTVLHCYGWICHSPSCSLSKPLLMGGPVLLTLPRTSTNRNTSRAENITVCFEVVWARPFKNKGVKRVLWAQPWNDIFQPWTRRPPAIHILVL